MTSGLCPPSKPLPVFNRCTPLDVSCYSRFADAMVTVVSGDSSLQRLISSVAASKEIIVGLCVLALGERTAEPRASRTGSRCLTCPLSPVPRPVHAPHDDHSLHLGRAGLDPHLAGGAGIAG